MDLFSITCTTCKSRLKVRDQGAIGQILACPKCGGMVMIKAPPAFSDATEQRSDLPTSTELVGPALRFDQTLDSSAFDVVDELLSDSPPKVPPPPTFDAPAPPPSATPTPKPRFVGGPPARSPGSTNGGAPKPNLSPPGGLPVPPPVKPAAPSAAAKEVNGHAQKPKAARDSASLAPPPPGETGTGEAAPPQGSLANPRRYWLPMAGSVGLGIVLAITAVAATIFFLRPVGRNAASAKVVTTKPAPAAAGKAAAPPTTSTPAKPAAAVDSTPVAPQVAATPAPPLPENNSPPPPAAPVDADPLGLATAPPRIPVLPTPKSDALAKFDRIIGGASDDPLAKPTALPEKTTPLPPLDAAPPDAAPPKPLAPRPPAREIDVARRLADPLPAIETTGTPLADFLQLISDLSTIPITLELPFPPATAESPVVLRLTNTTIEKALKEGLTALRLEFIISDDQLIVRRQEPNPFAPVPQDVKDLTGGEESRLIELADLLKSVVEPGAWGEEDGNGSIAVDVAKGTINILHRRAVQGQVLTAVEKLRSAHTPPLAHKWKLAASLFQLDSRLAQAQPRLEKSISLNYSQPTRLLTILDRLGAAAGVRILVDWHDVASAGWNPAAEANLVVDKKPLAAALDALLGPLDLAWRIIDGQTLQVVTPARLADQGELEFYKVDDLTAGDAGAETLLSKVRSALGDAAFHDGGGSGEIRYDANSKCLLAWLPQPKQRELESLLAKWRSGVKP